MCQMRQLKEKQRKQVVPTVKWGADLSIKLLIMDIPFNPIDE